VNFVSISVLTAFLAGTASVARADVKLADLFTDNMVLQRDATAPVWGTAAPGEAVTLTFGAQSLTATADANGAWKTAFQGLKPGAAQALTVTGAHNKVALQNVVVGDVWVTSGQSNMQYLLVDQDEIAASANPNIRYYETPRSMAAEPMTTLPTRGPVPWMIAAPETSPKMSAVAYYFAKNINKELGVPIGIIDCTWGGTPAEPWTSREALESVPEYKEPIDKAISAYQNQTAFAATYAADCAEWEKSFGRNDPGNTGFAAGWAAPGFDAGAWTSITTTSLPNWNNAGIPNGGAVWLRKTVSLPATAAGKDFTLTLGPVPGVDTAYFNGTEVGNGGWNLPGFARQPRSYKIPGSLVKAGDNVMAIRIFAQTTRTFPFAPGPKLGLPVSDPTSVSSDWLAHVESQLPRMTPEAMAAMPPYPYPPPGCTPALNFNAMVCPLMPYGIKGVLWYQGESNATYAYAYRTLLPLLIESWRARWNIGDFPFYIVQLPNLGNPPKDPEGNDTWPVLRESQLATWKKVPKTGMSVSIDIGEAMNLHPPDKKDVGYRLSLIALAEAYGHSIEDSGPIYETMTIEGNKIRVKFAHPGGGLVAKDGPLKQFAIAGADQKFVWADAAIDGDTVLVSNPGVTAPVAVRYAWAANPAGCNLYNQAGLPASPFRTDDWPVLTQGLWYPDRAGRNAAAPAQSPLLTPPTVEASPTTTNAPPIK
jgi:sialate O-acetylesterase